MVHFCIIIKLHIIDKQSLQHSGNNIIHVVVLFVFKSHALFFLILFLLSHDTFNWFQILRPCGLWIRVNYLIVTTMLFLIVKLEWKQTLLQSRNYSPMFAMMDY